jgi:hypothetical protein
VELRAALIRFGADAQAALAAASQKTEKALIWLAERQQYWMREVRAREAAVVASEQTLRRCLMSGDAEHPPSCGQYEQAMVAARARLRDAQEHLLTAQRWTKAVEESAAEYRAQAQRLSSLLQSDLPGATAYLDNKIHVLESYLSMSGTGGGGALAITNAADLFRSVADLGAATRAVEAVELRWLENTPRPNAPSTEPVVTPSGDPGAGLRGRHPETVGSPEYEPSPEAYEGGLGPRERRG